MVIKTGTVDDVPAVLAMLDGAVRWLVDNGREDQWGTAPMSAEQRNLDRTTTWARAGELYLAWNDADPVGALAVGDAPAHIPPAAEPELYINLLITDRAHAGLGIGARMLRHAREIATERGLGLLRVDCYAGNDGALVRYYEQQGFTATATFTVEVPKGPWTGQVLEQRLG
ncbi:GNAT family N-acetyltransferase [Phytoactinopolyspora sp. XMNu-373]|uniref:GNAT family N-acetyltransferase n=2 Tax=Phytoactinopolyspora mesophila TaxID=2650750 RepID=A0A7K3LZZ6_9ACTN|nr:GNAT family N-acetyltransferase [Phytoactinopolyspora mesophila]